MTRKSSENLDQSGAKEIGSKKEKILLNPGEATRVVPGKVMRFNSVISEEDFRFPFVVGVETVDEEPDHTLNRDNTNAVIKSGETAKVEAPSGFCVEIENVDANSVSINIHPSPMFAEYDDLGRIKNQSW